jgi:hypothetical protein
MFVLVDRKSPFRVVANEGAEVRLGVRVKDAGFPIQRPESFSRTTTPMDDGCRLEEIHARYFMDSYRRVTFPAR